MLHNFSAYSFGSCVVKQPDVEDYGDFKKIWDKLKENPHQSFKISGNLNDVKLYFKLHLTTNEYQIFLIYHSNEVCGFIVLQIKTDMNSHGTGVLNVCRDVFIRAVYVDALAPREASLALNEVTDTYAKIMNSKRIYGYCRPDFRENAANKKFGYKCKVIIMEKELT